MHDDPNVYSMFPYGEVQAQISDDTVRELSALITGAHVPGDDDTVSERLVLAREHMRSHILSTHMEAFTAMISDIHGVLVEQQRMPDYLRDTLCAMLRALQNTPNMTLRSQTGVLQDADMSEYTSMIWANSEEDRLAGSDVTLYESRTAGNGSVGVVLRKDGVSRWKLGMVFHEDRTYEIYNNGYLYRILGDQLFADPVGSEGDIKNIEDGMYLPSMLTLPNPRTSVNV